MIKLLRAGLACGALTLTLAACSSTAPDVYPAAKSGFCKSIGIDRFEEQLGENFTHRIDEELNPGATPVHRCDASFGLTAAINVQVTFMRTDSDAEQRFKNMIARGPSTISLDIPSVDQSMQWGDDKKLEIVIQDNNIVVQVELSRFHKATVDLDATVAEPFGEFVTDLIDELRDA